MIATVVEVVEVDRAIVQATKIIDGLCIEGNTRTPTRRKADVIVLTTRV